MWADGRTGGSTLGNASIYYQTIENTAIIDTTNLQKITQTKHSLMREVPLHHILQLSSRSKERVRPEERLGHVVEALLHIGDQFQVAHQTLRGRMRRVEKPRLPAVIDWM